MILKSKSSLLLPVWFQHSGDSFSDTMVMNLRGGPVFDVLPNLHGGLRVNPVLPEQGRILIPTQKNAVVFGDLSVLVNVPNLVASLKCPLIVDVHFPFGFSDRIVAIQDEDTERDVSQDIEAREYWSDPERISIANGILERADAITVSPVVRELDFPFTRLPDIKTPPDAGIFYIELMSLITKVTSWFPRIMEPVTRFRSAILATQVVERVVIPD